MASTSLGIVIGATLSSGFGKTFSSANKSAFSLGKNYRATDAKLRQAKGVTALRGKLEKLKAAQKQTGDSSGRYAAKIKATEKELWAASKAADKMGLKLGDIVKQQKKLGRLQKIQKLGLMAKGAVPTVKRAGLGIVGGATAAFGLAAKTASRGDDVAKTADKLGFGIEALQEYQYAAERSGMSQQEFNTAAQMMAKNVSEASNGVGQAKRELEELGVSAGDLVNLSPERQMEVLADALGGVQNSSHRARIAMKLFGRSGGSMVNMLKDGSKGLQRLRQDARATGNVMGEDAARAAEKYTDTMGDTKAIMGGLANTVGTALMPVMGSLMMGINNNRDSIIGFGQSISGAVDFMGGWMPVLSAVAVGVGVVMVGAISSAILSIKVLGLAIMANPLGLLVGGLVIGAGLLIANWDKVKSAVGGAMDWIGKKASWLWHSSPLGKLIKGVKALGSYLFGDDSPGGSPEVDPRIAKAQASIDAAQKSAAVNNTQNNQRAVSAPITVNAAPGMDEQQVAEQVAAQLAIAEQDRVAYQQGALYD